MEAPIDEDGGRGTKPTYIFMVIIPLLVIELKATPNGNPNNDFYWRQKSSSLNLVQIIPPVGLLYFTSKSTVYNLTRKFNQPGYVGVCPRSNLYLTIYQLQPIF